MNRWRPRQGTANQQQPRQPENLPSAAQLGRHKKAARVAPSRPRKGKCSTADKPGRLKKRSPTSNRPTSR
ncbi:hypothetical protein GCWU000246_00372 [Jonquetella anthropi E3_33 E1]|nr:hypothetical protein GCWU000246_00372 [Jonquetella anthropi E3_33 E1]